VIMAVLKMESIASKNQKKRKGFMYEEKHGYDFITGVSKKI